MALIDITGSIYAVAFLTEKGRKYLFDPNNSGRFVVTSGNVIKDKFKITHFSIGDSDVNYATSGVLGEGLLPSCSGNINKGCLTNTVKDKIEYEAFYDVSNLLPINTSLLNSVQIETDHLDNIYTININDWL